MTGPRRLLAVEGLVAGYSGPVVGPLSFSVAPGEVVGLNGANGVGKSTVIAAITRTARIFDGTIMRSAGLRVAHHRQRAVRPVELPVRATELVAASGADPGSAPDWVREVLERPVDELSGGQYQFLLAWICLAGPADLVLLDEPSNNLDARGIESLGTILRQLAPDRAVILVSHEADFLSANCSRIVEVG